jgi:hypothetical protein
MLLDTLLPSETPIGTAHQEIERREVSLPEVTPADATVLKIVVQDAESAESHLLMSGIISEWDANERLYLFHVPSQPWEGTTIPRANLGIPLVYEHIESILPQIMAGLFQDEPPFTSFPLPGTSMDTARAADGLLSYELRLANFKEESRLGLKSALLQGMGIWKLGWMTRIESVKQLRRKEAPKFQPLAMGGVLVGGSDELVEDTVEVEINEPTFEWVNIRHVLVDPGLRTQDIRKARFVIHRLYLTAEDLDGLREIEGYKIPSRERLIEIFFPPKEDALKSAVEASSGLDIAPEFQAVDRAEATTIDPLKQPLEVLEYWTPTHVYTVLQRKLVIRADVNEWGEIPFRSVAYSDILDSFWGIGVARLIGPEQRLQQGVTNAFLDDLSLSLNGMFKRKRGSNVPTQQLRMRPGGIIDSDDEEGVEVLQRQPIPLEVGVVLAASDARAQRRTAANELVVQGGMPAQKSSITRTATGVQTLTSGTGTRLQYLAENFATMVFIPTLEAFHKMNAKKLKPSQIEAILSKELGLAYQGDVVNILNARLKFQVLAASRLQAKRALATTLPLLFQFLLAEPVIGALQTEGKKVNIGEMVKMLYDVSGWPNRQDVIVEMSEEDQLRAALNNPAVAGMIAQQQQLQTRHEQAIEMNEEENLNRSGRDVIQAILKSATAPKSEGKPAKKGAGK